MLISLSPSPIVSTTSTPTHHHHATRYEKPQAKLIFDSNADRYIRNPARLHTSVALFFLLIRASTSTLIEADKHFQIISPFPLPTSTGIEPLHLQENSALLTHFQKSSWNACSIWKKLGDILCSLRRMYSYCLWVFTFLSIVFFFLLLLFVFASFSVFFLLFSLFFCVCFFFSLFINFIIFFRLSNKFRLSPPPARMSSTTWMLSMTSQRRTKKVYNFKTISSK